MDDAAGVLSIVCEHIALHSKGRATLSRLEMVCLALRDCLRSLPLRTRPLPLRTRAGKSGLLCLEGSFGRPRVLVTIEGRIVLCRECAPRVARTLATLEDRPVAGISQLHQRVALHADVALELTSWRLHPHNAQWVVANVRLKTRRSCGRWTHAGDASGVDWRAVGWRAALGGDPA